MNIGTWLERAAAHDPARPALFAGRTQVSDYAGFAKRARHVAGLLAQAGVVAGDHVAIFMENVPDYLCVQYGIWFLGAVAVPINAKLHAREAGWIIGNAEAKVVFATASKAEALGSINTQAQVIDVEAGGFETDLNAAQERACAPRAPDDLAWLFYTSGTTGQPKGVMITHRMLVAMSLSYFADVDEVRSEDAAIYAAPLSHGAGIYNMVHVLKGARHVFPPSRGFDPAEIFELAAHFGSVHMFAAPTMVKRLTSAAQETGASGTGLRTIVYAGGPMYVADIMEASAQFGDIFVQIYGQGECPMAITALPRSDVSDRTHRDWKARLASVGRAQSGCDVRIGGRGGAPVPAGETGEIMVRGDVVMPGYWRNEGATAKTIVDGWLMTGDMGFMDAAGYVTMVDRSKDMIISGGSNIYPREVEEVLLLHPQVIEASVVGRAHPEWGEDVVAFVVAEGALDTAELDALCLDHIARFKRPKAYLLTDALPKNNYGKVLKTELRARL